MNQLNTTCCDTITNRSKESHFRITSLLVCFAISLIIVTVCSKSSFLYPLNDWEDANCFFTVGKSIKYGIVPYRDLYEQKGPLLYFLYALASLISYDSFIGVYLIEVFCCTVFLYYSYKIMELYCRNISIFCIPLLAVAVYTSRSFFHGGSAEELCFPILTISLYYFLKAAKHNSYPTNRESFLIGFFSACIFWIKFTLVGMYVGWFGIFFCDMIYHKKGRILSKIVLFIVLGLVVGSFPYLLYFGLHYAVNDLIEVYIYDNITKYTVTNSGSNLLIGIAKNLYIGIKNLYYNFVVIILIGIGGGYCIINKWKKELLYVGSMIIITFVFCYGGGRSYPYYALSFVPFACIGFVPICLILSKKTKQQIWARSLCFICAVLMACTAWLTPNRYLMLANKDNLPQYQFAKTITNTPGHTLLNYGFLDGGFYTTTGIIPNCRAFCKLNIPIDELKELQYRYVRNGLCDYVVTKDEELTDADSNKLYVLSNVSQFYLEGNIHTYYLYQLVSLDSEAIQQ